MRITAINGTQGKASAVTLYETLDTAGDKKQELLTQDYGRFAVRAVLAGMYLTLGTAFAAVAGQVAEGVAPGTGGLVFACLFGLGLFAIVVLGAELATGSMMFVSWSTARGRMAWGVAFRMVAVATFYNFIGAAIVALVLSQSAKLGGIDDTHLMSTLTEGKLAKPFFGAFVEAMGANFVVNMAVLGALQAKEIISKFVVILPIIAVFVGLGLEHVIANFSLFSLAFFADPHPAAFDGLHITVNWVAVWLGNFVGGGLGIGSVYAWLNQTKTSYVD